MVRRAKTGEAGQNFAKFLGEKFGRFDLNTVRRKKGRTVVSEKRLKIKYPENKNIPGPPGPSGFPQNSR